MALEDEQLDELNSKLHKLSEDMPCMNLSEFDGFVAGLIVCPEMVPPSEWLPIVFGRDSLPDLGNTSQTQETLDVLFSHYNAIAKNLAKQHPEYAPVLGHDPNSDETLWEPWIEGFERAMRLRPDAWLEIVEADDEEVSSTISLIIELHRVYHGESELDEDAIDHLDEVTPGLIPSMVLNLNSWTKAQARLGDVPSDTSQRRTKVGRNDPCPCGSGKKYKKCCGSVMLH